MYLVGNSSKIVGRFALSKSVLPECPCCGNPRYFGNNDQCEYCGQRTDVYFDQETNEVNQLARDRYGCWD